MSSARKGENLQDEILDYIKNIQNFGEEVVLMYNSNVKLTGISVVLCIFMCLFFPCCAIQTAWGVGVRRAGYSCGHCVPMLYPTFIHSPQVAFPFPGSL